MTRFLTDEEVGIEAPTSPWRTTYAKYAEQWGLHPDPKHPDHKYDYESAIKAGHGPDETGHWPSEKYKADTHPNRFVVNERGETVDTKYNKIVPAKITTSRFLTDKEVGIEAPTLISDVEVGLGGEINTENYGRVAAIQIERRRNQARDAGEDLNQNEQVAILDAYRVFAGLDPLTWDDTFAETQQHIAQRQGNILNLARATSSAFQRQAVNLVAPAVDRISPGWGTSVRADIAALNPYDPERASGKAGGAVAALPLLLAGGGIKSAAAIFGLFSGAESLAFSEDTGVTGLKKWGGAASSGAITAGSILLGGKIAQWAGKVLGSRIPQLRAILDTGGPEGVAKVIAREASLAGISLPTRGTTMLAGTVANNLVMQQTTDPNRQWDDGLGDTAFNVAAMTLAIHTARAGQALAAPAPKTAPTTAVTVRRVEPGTRFGGVAKVTPLKELPPGTPPIVTPQEPVTTLATRPKPPAVPGPERGLVTRPVVKPPATPPPGFLADETGSLNLGAIGKLGSKAIRGIVNLGNAVTGEMAFTVSHVPAGKNFVGRLDNISVRGAMLTGPIENMAMEAVGKLSRDDMRWLKATSDMGYSNIQRLTEDTPDGPLEVPNPEIQAVVDAYDSMLDITGKEAVRVNMKVRTPDGRVIDFKQAREGRWLRNLLPDARQALMQGSGPLFDSIATTVARDNEGLDLRQAEEFLREWVGPKSVRKVGHLEQLRAIRYLPSAVMMGNSEVMIQELNPYKAIVNSARKQARRIYMVEEFEQGIEGEPTEIDRLRAEYQKQGGNTRNFDDLIAVFEGRPFKRVFGDPRNPIARALNTVDRLIATAQTSLSVVPNIPQTLILVPKYVGEVRYLKAIKEVLKHPKQTAAQLTMMGAMNRAFLDLTVRPGYMPEDIVAAFGGLVSRATGLEAMSQFNNAVAGIGFVQLADSWRDGGISSGDKAAAKDLRLTPAEISEVNAGRMTDFIRAKIVQNGVKITQFITEDPHRKSLLQNIPALNKLFAYNSYGIGTTKASIRTVRESFNALKPGATAVQRGKAAHRLYLFLLGATTAGTIALMLRRAVKGQPIVREDETLRGLITRGLWESALLGPAQRMQDSYEFGGSIEKAAIGISPKIAAGIELLKALRGEGKWGEFSASDRAWELTKKQAPVVRAMENWWRKLRYPQITTYNKVRSMASVYRPSESKIRDISINPVYYNVHQAILRDEPEELKVAMEEFYRWAKEPKKDRPDGWDDKEARRNLRSALSSRRPVNFGYAAYREFLGSLPQGKQDMVAMAQAQYTVAMDQVTLTPAEAAAQTGDLQTLRETIAPDTPRSKIKGLFRTAAKSALEREVSGLGVNDALRVWDTASEEEKKKLRPILLRKFRSAQSRMTQTKFNALAAQYRIKGVFK